MRLDPRHTAGAGVKGAEPIFSYQKIQFSSQNYQFSSRKALNTFPRRKTLPIVSFHESPYLRVSTNERSTNWRSTNRISTKSCSVVLSQVIQKTLLPKRVSRMCLLEKMLRYLGLMKAKSVNLRIEAILCPLVTWQWLTGSNEFAAYEFQSKRFWHKEAQIGPRYPTTISLRALIGAKFDLVLFCKICKWR